jgi:voltage-gated potassium channel
MRWQIGALEIQEALRTIHIFFDVLTADQLSELAHECSPQSFDAGEVLMRQGDPSNSMFCVVEGTVSVSSLGPRNHDREIFRLSAGTTVGEMELLTGEPRLATVTALTQLRLLEISRAEFESLLRRSPELRDSFGASLARRQAIRTSRVPGLQKGFGAVVLEKLRSVFSRRA